MERHWMMEKAERGREWLTDLLFPRRCPVCGKIVVPKGGLICPGCVKKLSFVKGPVCMRCGKELIWQDGEYCHDCMRHRRSFERGAALLNYNEAAAASMAQIKYKNKREYLDFYSLEMVRRLGKRLAGMGADAFVPVPVHPSRRRTRGFDQAEELADRLSRQTGIPVLKGALIRSKKTMPQKALTPEQRLRNLEQAFLVVPEKLWKGMERVVLVDDIYTTGSTIEACSRVLKRAGIKKIYFVSICIGGDR